MILGSLPSRKSLEKQQYYAFSQNSFWKIMFDIFQESFSFDYKTRCDLLLKNNIALWDVIYEANRDNSSLDSDIKNITINDFQRFLKEHKKITKIIFNGQKAKKEFEKQYKEFFISTYTLPSTSPANAKIKYEIKFNIWKEAILD